MNEKTALSAEKMNTLSLLRHSNCTLKDVYFFSYRKDKNFTRCMPVFRQQGSQSGGGVQGDFPPVLSGQMRKYSGKTC
jgi:hypothetical protein